MKALIPWLCIVAVIPLEMSYADPALNSYREGHYTQAANLLAAHSKQDAFIDYYLARMNLYGYGKLKNNTLAIRYFKEAALKGYLPAQQFMAHYALYVMHNPDEALSWFKKAAEADDLSAQMYCAAAYRYGLGTRKNEDMAKRYYIAAARNGNSIAQYSLAQSFFDTRQLANKKLGLIWLNKSVAQGNPVAQTLLAEYYATGNLVEHDLAKATELLKLAMAQNYAPARYQMGQISRQQHDYLAAKDWYTQAANNAYAPAEMALAALYLDQETPFHDDHTGFLWMLKAAQNGSSEAQRQLSAMYKAGHAVTADLDLAKSWEKQAWLSDHNPPVARAMQQAANWLTNGAQSTLAASGYRLAGIYSPWNNRRSLKENNYNQSPQMSQITRDMLFKPKFILVDPNQISIAEYYDAFVAATSVSAKNGLLFPDYPLSNKPLALTNNTTSSDAADKATAAASVVAINLPVPSLAMQQPAQPEAKEINLIEQLKSRAVLGDPDAQFNLGQIYRFGAGVTKDSAIAEKYYELAAAQQDLRAEYMLATLRFANQNYLAALDGLTDAAFKGNAMAQYALGQLKARGLTAADGQIIIAPNSEQAVALYSLAAANGFAPAQYLLAELMTRQHSSNLTVAVKQKQNQLIKSLYEGAVAGGITQAEVPLAFFNAMDSSKVTQAKSFAVAQKKAAEGDAAAALLLGLMYDRGIAVTPDHTMALTWYQRAAQTPVSAFILGTDFSNRGDMTQGIALLKKAADGGFSYADLNLAVMQQQKNEDFLPELNKAIAAGNSTAAILLADYYLSRTSDETQQKQARTIFQQLAEKGHRDGQLKLGYMMEHGLGGATDALNSEHWYRLAAEQDQAEAQYLLGHTYQLGFIDKQPDYLEAKRWYAKAQNTYTPAAIALGFIYDTVDDNYHDAELSYQLAAANNDPIGQFNLALINEQGKGKSVNFDLAKTLYTEAASHGHHQAMVQLAGLYLNGLGGSRDEQQAYAWYDKAAKAGDSDAEYQLGLLAETGVGTPLNHTAALRYYQQAADKGNAKATLALARMYQHGIGVAEDQQQAEKLYQDVSLRDNPYAQYQLAKFYFSDQGGHQLAKGMQLLKQAEDDGSQQAASTLQWLKAQEGERVSYLAPIAISQLASIDKQPVDLMYLYALNALNRGEEESSKNILARIVKQYPDYTPAKRTYEQLSQQMTAPILREATI